MLKLTLDLFETQETIHDSVNDFRPAKRTVRKVELKRFNWAGFALMALENWSCNIEESVANFNMWMESLASRGEAC